MNQAPAPTHDTAGAPTRSVTICRVVGIPIRVHWTFAFLVVWCSWPIGIPVLP